MAYKQKLNCTNGSGARMRLVLEVWQEEYWLEPAESLEVIGCGGAEGGCFEVERFDGGVMVYGWQGCVMMVLRNGKLEQPVKRMLIPL